MLKSGRIRVQFEGESPQGDDDDVEFVVAAPRLFTIFRLLTGPDFWVGETYIRGRWYLLRGNLSDFLKAVEEEANRAYRGYYRFLSSIRGPRYYLRQYLLNKHFTRQVKRHYEVDSEIYEMILDEEMLYTCAFFSKDANSLVTAQKNKVSMTISRMRLPPGPKTVLDIGSGWGALGRAIVRHYDDARVCALSISFGQIDWAKARDRNVLSESERQRIEYRLEDYIAHRGVAQYDAVAVVGMIEHVGLGGYAEFFQKVHNFLKPGGVAVIHTIVSPLPAVPTNSWIDKHIFTGGYAPSISELVASAEKLSFRIVGVHIYGPSHYRRTIECWLTNFMDNRDTATRYLRGKGYNDGQIDTFIRTWMFYLSGVRNMFDDHAERSHQVAQLVLKRLNLEEIREQVAKPNAHCKNSSLS
jgi:cyclopropane-fatty-acyl-phospholipid synthase